MLMSGSHLETLQFLLRPFPRLSLILEFPCNLDSITAAIPSWGLSCQRVCRINQEMETALHLLVLRNPSSWSAHLPWAESIHNFLMCSVTGLFPFQCTSVYQPLISTALGKEAACPSAQPFIRRCRQTWSQARTTLLC